ncbi:hypothetical protein RHOSPDRAFT_33158 [Rhodotorula sp. JG-1b]|nr:hypothetical protein RHOSPDRAFT_33158 [Rhodotorula sp. JG-1b]
MPPRSTALPTRFFPADPESTDLTLPTPPSEFNLPPRDSGGPGPSSLAHRLSLAAASSEGLPVSDLHVNETVAAGPTSTSRKRKAVAPTTTGARKRVQKTDQVDTSAFSGKGKGKRSHASAAGAQKGKASSTSSSTVQDIRVQPSSDVEDDDDNEDDDEESNTIRPRSKKRLGSEAFGSGAASDDAYTDDDSSSSEIDESAEAPVGSSEEEEEPEEPARRKSGRRRRDSPSYVEPLHPADPTTGGPGYEGFTATLFGSGGGGGGALKSVKTLPPLVPPSLRGSEDLKALLLASVEDDDDEEVDGEEVGVGGLGGIDAEGVHHQKPPAKNRPGLTTTQRAELERASDPTFATTLLKKVAGRISALDTAYSRLSEELSKAQLEASVLGNVKSLLKARRDMIRKPPIAT